MSPVTAPEVLLYHRVADTPVDNQYLSVHPDNFEEHLAILSMERKVVPLFDLVQAAHKGHLVDGGVAITFDDGYADNLLNALPLLEKYRCHATIFVTAGVLGSALGFWYDVLEDVFLAGRAVPPSLYLPVVDERLSLSSPEDVLAAHDVLLDACKKASPRLRNLLLHDILQGVGIDPAVYTSSNPILTREQVRELSASPWVELGVHTLTHPVLAELSEDAQHHEIHESARLLTEITGKQTRILAYPFGNREAYTAATCRITKEAGLLGIANVQGCLALPLDVQNVPRRLVRNWSGQQFQRWLRSADRGQLEHTTTMDRTQRLLRILQRVPAVQTDAGRTAPADTINDIFRTEPVSRQFGLDRGTAIDRVYIENFLRTHAEHIRNRVLEIGGSTYTRQFGTAVTHSDVLNVVPCDGATIVGSLEDDALLPDSSFDCIIFTQTLHVISQIHTVLKNLGKALAPGGCLLLTAPCISQISRYDMDRWGDYWRFTDKGLHTLLHTCIAGSTASVQAHGNLAIAKAFLDGRSAGELPDHLFRYDDPDYQVLLTACVTKSPKGAAVLTEGSQKRAPEVPAASPASEAQHYYPTQLAIEPVRGCNARCIMCPQQRATRPGGTLKTAHLTLMLEKVKQWGAPITVISHAGLGEPLLDKELEKKIVRDKAVFPNAMVAVYSNGGLLNRERNISLLESGVDVLSFSVNALHDETYAKITGLDRNKVYASILELLELREKRRVNTAINVSCIPIPELPQAELHAFQKFWGDKAHAVLVPPVINWGGDWGEVVPDQATRLPCNYIFSVLMVDWDGTVKRCCEDYDSKYPMGNLLDQDPHDIFNSPMLVAQRRAQLQGDFRQPYICKKCVETSPRIAGEFWSNGGGVPCW